MIARRQWLLLLLVLVMPALAQMTRVASVTHLDGVLSAARSDGSQKLLGVSSDVFLGDVLETAARSFARIKFTDDGEVVLRPRSRFQVSDYKFRADEESGSLMRLLKGGLRAVTGAIGKNNKENVKLETPVAVIGIRGTNFGALFCAGDCQEVATVSGSPLSDGLYVDVAEGAIIVTNAAGQLLVQAGQFAYVADADTAPVLLSPEQGVRVTMPTRISKNTMDGGGLGGDNGEQCIIPAS